MIVQITPTQFIPQPADRLPPRRRVGPFVRGQVALTIAADITWTTDAAIAEAALLICDHKAGPRVLLVSFYDNDRKLYKYTSKVFDALDIDEADVSGELQLFTSHEPMREPMMQAMAKALTSGGYDLLVWHRPIVDWEDLDALRDLAEETGVAVSLFADQLVGAAEDAEIRKARKVSHIRGIGGGYRFDPPETGFFGHEPAEPLFIPCSPQGH